MNIVPLSHLETFAASADEVNVIIDTPKGSRNKYSYDETRHLFYLKSVMPLGAAFPFDFGFIPSSRSGDGDPLDVLVLMEDASFVGCLVGARLIGVIEVEQTKNGRMVRNDRLIAVAVHSRAYQEIGTVEQLRPHMLEEIEHFFHSYNMVEGREFRVCGRFGPERAEQIVERGVRRFLGDNEVVSLADTQSVTK